MSKGKKSIKKKVVDPYTRKDWYDIKAPSCFSIRQVGKTLVNRSQGIRNAEDDLRGRVLESSLGDLNTNSEDQSFRKFRLRVDEVQGRNCLTSFHGMSLTSDKLKSMVKKWQTLIEAHSDLKTTDGYLLRLFCIGFTKRRPQQIRKTSYAQTSQVKAIRKKMFDIMSREITGCDLREVVQKLIPDIIGKEIEKACQAIYPLQNVCIFKVKVIKSPKFDIQKLMELHTESGNGNTGIEAPAANEDLGQKIESGWKEPTPATSV